MRLVLLVVPVLALGLTACGSSKKADTTDSLSGAQPSAAAAPTSSDGFIGPRLASSPAGPAGPSVAPPGSAALPGVPAVTADATDLAKEPKVAAGTGTAPIGLVTRDLVVGKGTAAVASDSVNVRYEGTLFTDGSVFDASWKNGSDPTNFSLSQVVPGFAEGIVGMQPGGRREIVIPPALGYQDQAQAAIPAKSTLVFIVDLVSTGAGQ